MDHLCNKATSATRSRSLRSLRARALSNEPVHRVGDNLEVMILAPTQKKNLCKIYFMSPCPLLTSPVQVQLIHHKRSISDTTQI